MRPVACSRGEPISWLRLERFQLGELAGEEQRSVAEHLEGCPVCRGCLEQQIRGAQVVLRPLVFDGGRASLPAAPAARVRRPLLVAAAARGPYPDSPRRRSGRLALYATLAAAAVAALLLSTRLLDRAEPERSFPASRIGLKGGELALTLVRERGGRTLVGAASYAPGDRLKALVTAPCGAALRAELVVIEGRETSFPLARGPLACGNQVPLEGAFQLTGKRPVAVCVIASEAELPMRSSLARGAPLPAGSVCALLDPEPY